MSTSEREDQREMQLEALFDDPSLATLLDPGPPPADVPAGKPFLPWRLRPLSPAEFRALGQVDDRLSRLQLAYLCWHNSLAPSSHNSNPQRFRVLPGEGTGGGVELWLDRRFVLAASDPVARQACVSLGCGLANTELVARRYGWQTRVEVLPVATDRLAPAPVGEARYELIARLRFHPQEPAATTPAGPEPGPEPDWVRLALARKLIRAEFDERVELEPAVLAELEAVVAGFAGVRAHVIRDAPTLLFLAKFQELADTTVLNRDEYAIELGEWLLEDHDGSPRGMRGAEFGLSPKMTRRFHYGLLRELELLPDEVASFAKASNVAMRSSSAVVVLTVDEDTLSARLNAGRVYQEIALRLWRHRLCTAMHAAITEVEGPNLALRGRLRTRARPTVLFRVGRPLRESDWQRPHAARPLLSELLLPEQADRLRR